MVIIVPCKHSSSSESVKQLLVKGERDSLVYYMIRGYSFAQCISFAHASLIITIFYKADT